MRFGDEMNNNRHIGRRVTLAENMSVHYVTVGEGPPVILLHGFLQSLYVWRYVIEPIAAAGFSVYALDWPGAGYSDCPSMYYNRQDYSEILEAFLQELGLGPAALLGSGYGAMAAVSLALDCPGLVSRLLLLSPGNMERGYPRIFRLLRGTLGNVASHRVSERSVEAYLQTAYFDETRITPALVEQYWLPLLMPGAREALLANARSCRRDDLLGSLHMVQHPTLFLWGEKDPFHAPEIAYRMAHELENSQVEILPHCAHHPQEERPQDFSARVIAFLNAPHPDEGPEN